MGAGAALASPDRVPFTHSHRQPWSARPQMRCQVSRYHEPNLGLRFWGFLFVLQ